jgi:hypothetical protein
LFSFCIPVHLSSLHSFVDHLIENYEATVSIDHLKGLDRLFSLEGSIDPEYPLHLIEQLEEALFSKSSPVANLSHLRTAESSAQRMS